MKKRSLKFKTPRTFAAVEAALRRCLVQRFRVHAGDDDTGEKSMLSTGWVRVYRAGEVSGPAGRDPSQLESPLFSPIIVPSFRPFYHHEPSTWRHAIYGAIVLTDLMREGKDKELPPTTFHCSICLEEVSKTVECMVDGCEHTYCR